MGSGVNPQQLFKGRQRSIVIAEISIDALRNQMVIDRGQTLRTLRVMRAHVVQLAVAMGNEGSGGHLFSLCEAAHGIGARRFVIIDPFCKPLQALESI